MQIVFQPSSPSFCPILTTDSCLLTSRFLPILDTRYPHFGQPPSTLCLGALGCIFRFHAFLSRIRGTRKAGQSIHSREADYLILDTCSPHFGHRYCTAFLWVLWVLWGLWVSWTSPQSVVSVASVAIPLFGHLFTFPHSRETPVLHSVFITFLACLSRICGTRKRGKTFHSRAAGFIYSFQITFRCSAPLWWSFRSRRPGRTARQYPAFAENSLYP